MGAHPDLPAEQTYLDHAYRCLESARRRAQGLRRLGSLGPGGTHQARHEREVVEDTIRSRLAQLELGDVALVFGRIDAEGTAERFYIGRIGVADEDQESVVVDWRAPVAEPFYRATGRDPMGLARRRHFATRGRRLLGIEDEWFGSDDGGGGSLAGPSALLAAVERPRSGFLGDIVATIQVEQDQIIRDPLGGVVVVQGGPGTGKTVVALHRAAYLLYTHRFPLEDQGVLVVGPNRLYLRYIERVLPSLGEAGVELGVVADLVPEPVGDARGRPDADRVKGDLRMVEVVVRAVADRQRPLRHDLVVGLGLRRLRCSAGESERIVATARRRAATHNSGRRLVERALWQALAGSARDPLDPAEVGERLRRHEDVRAALEWMWPVLTPAQLLRDLFGSPALTRLAAAGQLSGAERASLYRSRDDTAPWSGADVALLDEARARLGSHPRRRRPPGDDELRRYGHLVVDEAQDLSPMQLRMLARRALGGSMTVVGDIAQATGPWAPASWDEVLAHLPARHPPRIRELTIGYRTPASVLSLANLVLAEVAPGLRLPRSLREEGENPVVVAVAGQDRAAEAAEVAAAESGAVGEGNVAVIVPDSLLGEVGAALTAAGVDHGDAARRGLEAQVNLVPVRLVKGLELDAVVVVEPARIVAEEPQGLRSLYVALTRATRRLTVVHAEPLPEPLRRAGSLGGCPR
ncbi:MAG: HelD family protein [Acidimicrobiales bacterium]